MRTTEQPIGSIRADGEGRFVSGIVVPYGTVSPHTEFGRETFAPGAFASDSRRWMERGDGARVPFRPAHRERPIGSVVELRDTPEGLWFRASVRPGPRGDEYLADVADGLNGVSVEFNAAPPRRMRDGTAIHREATIHGIAGAIAPAYDTARVSLRDMEDIEMDQETPVEREQPVQAAEPIVSERAAVEIADARQFESSIRITRPELVYGARSGQSFIQDLVSAQHDTAAAERQHRHRAFLTDISRQMERAGDLLQSEIPGILPTEFLPGLATPAVAQDTPMSSFFNSYAISDPKPRTFGKVTTSTAVSTTAKTEGAAPTVTDMATTAVTVTPAVYAAQIDVSREVIDAADPIAERLLLQDLTNRFNETIEAKVLAAVESGASASGTAITAATPFAGMLGNINKYYATRYTQAQAQFVPSALYAVALSQLDSSGRPILPFTAPYNANGTVMAGGAGAYINGARVYLSPASTTNVVVTATPSDYVIYRSPMLTFRYTEVVGPQSIRIAVFGYLGIGTRLGSLKVTAA